ncbi:MAG: hypothetical protein ACLFQQ_15330 [Desulfococcaceae bacterium]
MNPANNNHEMMVSQVPGSGTFQFSGTRPENLGATECALATIVADETSGVAAFADEPFKAVQPVLAACRKNPRADNLMVRLVRSTAHGFKPLSAIDPAAYDRFRPDGMTAPYDATRAAAGATKTYAASLGSQDFDVNGAIYVITDGADNVSSTRPKTIADKIRAAEQGDDIESLVTAPAGLKGPGARESDKIVKCLPGFQKDAKLTRQVDVGDAAPDRMSRLAAFVSQSIGSQSQGLGTGAASQPLTF